MTAKFFTPEFFGQLNSAPLELRLKFFVLFSMLGLGHYEYDDANALLGAAYEKLRAADKGQACEDMLKLLVDGYAKAKDHGQ